MTEKEFGECFPLKELYSALCDYDGKEPSAEDEAEWEGAFYTCCNPKSISIPIAHTKFEQDLYYEVEIDLINLEWHHSFCDTEFLVEKYPYSLSDFIRELSYESNESVVSKYGYKIYTALKEGYDLNSYLETEIINQEQLIKAYNWYLLCKEKRNKYGKSK